MVYPHPWQNQEELIRPPWQMARPPWYSALISQGGVMLKSHTAFEFKGNLMSIFYIPSVYISIIINYISNLQVFKNKKRFTT